jgi:gluconate kinase
VENVIQEDLKAFIHERARNLAIVYLTRSHDVLIESINADCGLHMLVTLLRDQLPM